MIDHILGIRGEIYARIYRGSFEDANICRSLKYRKRVLRSSRSRAQKAGSFHACYQDESNSLNSGG